MAFHPPKPTPKGLWRRTPPAIFPATLGLLGLALGWRRGVGQFALPPGLADLFLGAVTLFALFALLTYVVKLMRRPAVVLEDLRILPGRAGLAAAVLCLYLLALFVVRARWLLSGGFSPLWGALTFPLAATATFWLALGGAWTLPGAVLLVAATIIIVPIALQVAKLWAKGTLAIKTNAAIA